MDKFESWLKAVTTSPFFLWASGLGLAFAVVLWAMNHVQLKRSDVPRWSDKAWLNSLTWFGIFFLPILIFLFFAILWLLARTILAYDPAEPDIARWLALAIVGLLTSLGGIIGTPLALIRVHTTERQTVATEEGLVTDRINKAVENLGATRVIKRQRRRETGALAYEKGEHEKPNYDKPIFEEVSEPNLEVRIGGIYALERIAKQNLDYHIQVIEIITAYIRQNAPALSLEPTNRPFERAVLRAEYRSRNGCTFT